MGVVRVEVVGQTNGQRVLEGAQTKKGEFITRVIKSPEGESPSVAFSVHEASLAFGIRRSAFDRLSERRGVFIIESKEGDEVVLSLIPQVTDLRRALWDEMVRVFEQERSEHGRLLDGYKELYTFVQLCHQERIEDALQFTFSDSLLQISAFSNFLTNFRESEEIQLGDLEILQGIGFVFFGGLAPGTRIALAHSGQVPWLMFVTGE